MKGLVLPRGFKGWSEEAVADAITKAVEAERLACIEVARDCYDSAPIGSERAAAAAEIVHDLYARGATVER